MALAYRGLEVDTLAAAERIFDSAHDIYGNWTRAIQGAYSFGAPGYLARFSDWSEVARHIANGTPLVISIAAKEGELDGAPYPKTAGHLLVLCGFDAKGDVHVNDPAASTPEAGRLIYRRDQLERVWMARGGGPRGPAARRRWPRRRPSEVRSAWRPIWIVLESPP